jgi:hypothetical protein
LRASPTERPAASKRAHESPAKPLKPPSCASIADSVTPARLAASLDVKE